MALSIITPSRTDSFCSRLLWSIERYGTGQEEVIVVDSGLSEDFRKEWNDRVQFVPTSLPFNYSKAINVGVAAAAPERALLLINDDCEILTAHFSSLIDVVLRATEAQEYGVISLKINGGVGNEEQKTIADGTLIQETLRTVCFVAVVIRRECWNQVGPLDSHFPGSFSDDDYNFSARKAGWKCGITGMVTVRHGVPGGRPSANSFTQYMDPAAHQAQSRRSRDYFLAKWKTLPDPAHYKL